MIHILWPTVRPQMAADRAKIWIERSCAGMRSSNCHIVFSVEPRDDAGPLRKLRDDFQAITVFTSASPYPGVCHSATTLTQRFDVGEKDVVVLASDDFEPSAATEFTKRHWDSAIEKFFAENKHGCLLDDGYKSGTNIVSIPIVSGALLKSLGNVLYNPHYHHFYSDQELHDILTEMDEIVDLRDKEVPLFKHLHWSFNGRTRDLHDSRHQEAWRRDRATYESRKSLPLARKFELPEGWK